MLHFLIAVGRRKLRKNAIGLSVMKTNTRAVRVYEKCGFRIRGQCTFRSMNDSYVMELEFAASDREDIARLDEHYRRVLGIPNVQWGGEGTLVFPMAENLEDAKGGEWMLDAACLLRHGKCLVSARSDIHDRVREVISGVSIPESVFGEDLRRELEAAVLSAPGRPVADEGILSVWSSIFYCPAGELRHHPDPNVRELSAREAASLENRLEFPSRSLSRISDTGRAWARYREGRIRACSWSDEVGGADPETARVFATPSDDSGEFKDTASALSSLIADLQRQGRTAFAETEFDDLHLIRALDSVGMRKYGDLYRIWRVEGSAIPESGRKL